MKEIAVSIESLREFTPSQIKAFMKEGEPFIRVRDEGYYWLFVTLFSSSSFFALDGDKHVGIILAIQSQDKPEALYIQDVVVHRAYYRRGIATLLLRSVEEEARRRGCRRLWLTTKPGNPAVQVWPRLGFADLAGDYEVDGLQVRRDFKGLGGDRIVFEKILS